MNEGSHGASRCMPARCAHGPHTCWRSAQQPSQNTTATLMEWPPSSVSILASSSRGSHRAPLEPLEGGTAKHLARERLQAIDGALHSAMTPGQGDPSFDGVVVVAQPFRKPLQGRERTLQ